MADITPHDLAAARKAVGLYQHQVARLMHVSEDVISDWETGKTLPHPDQVDKLEELYKAPGLWYGWMRYHIKSFRDRYPEDGGSRELALSRLNAQDEVADRVARQEAVIRDALDGRIDDERSFAAYIKEAKEAHAALGMMLARAECKEG